jgi:uncharacterized membrane protein YecN with MAPEG domain
MAHVLCLLLLAGRICHAIGFGLEPERFRLRATGMMLTFIAIAGAAVRLLWLWVLTL